VLTGDGADELFGGYSRHLKTAKLKRFLPIPNSVQTWIAGNGRSKTNRIIQSAAITQAGPTDPLGWLHWHLVFRPSELEDLFIGMFNKSKAIKLLGNKVLAASQVNGINSRVEGLLLRDSDIWLTNESNRKLDKISMKYAIEARSPFQDDFVLANSKNMMSKFDFKILNKDLLRSEFPEVEILGVRRDKAGFTSPVGHWLRSNPAVVTDSLTLLAKELPLNRTYLMELSNAPYSGEYRKIMKLWSLIVLSYWIQDIK
jgi:asparagine synthase (glutamine-hydrolysing)